MPTELLQVARDAPVDVQIGPVLYEDAPQELRSRMWWALLENPKLVSLLGTERVSASGRHCMCTRVYLPSAVRACTTRLLPQAAAAAPVQHWLHFLADKLGVWPIGWHLLVCGRKGICVWLYRQPTQAIHGASHGC